MKYIAIDLGLKRIGLAYSAHKDIATPLSAVERKNRNQAASEVKKALDEWEVDAVVVGIPIGGSSEDEMRRRVEHFMNLVDFKGEIFYQDESNSSIEAENMIKGEIKHIRDGRIDSISAMIILQRYLRTIK
ncbi:MAG: Holliday junction DNA helicase RuvA [Sulfurimonas sp. RIFOXYD12_FULL_33_39]|uniref:Holliday junction resolvase RuvX n=1 Tax=unclassified Sulfurimonas TaxID=2623549 RepID=UPI0008C327F1|nr:MULTISPECIES: Holliday junction resolvase RuvX [unclassified Sulfurimonas]OHE04012.1 MAG: Holliday junction DNA helicase RuvA [Sulfurimonas sp. RIFCSPLOWO2_12_FULL_34_6]OHE08741.1 MAG: Holliday junction DNA helicase RuvA [Sulfurimonas sp. RIFOXYD12_FULL_33_39]OHE14026.1 MAG: Holliday junction DNA helicase RuvA [Sulfurimonas sp. RIFOXYD2_FULL_34_21]DAB27635.1 MAG TPA: Holliday junction resolvase RuvX [Sulfurimonas sp. UBA10385]